MSFKRSVSVKYYLEYHGHRVGITHLILRPCLKWNHYYYYRSNPERYQKAGKPPHNITLVKGAVHIVASRGFVEFALHDQRAKDLYEWSRNVDHPDEVFFSSLNHNPQLGAPGSYKGTLDEKFFLETINK